MEKILIPVKCVSCGSDFQGMYCNICGEKVNDTKERTVVYFLKQVFSAITFSDSKLLRTLKYLIFAPGKLSAEHRIGRRVKYTSPLQLFFLANLIYFILQPIDVLNTPLGNQQYQMYDNVAESVTVNKMESEGITYQVLEQKYNDLSESISKLLLIIMVLIFAVAVSILFYNKKYLFYDHLIFSLHFFSFLIFILFLFTPYFVKLLAALSSTLQFNLEWILNNEDIFTIVFILPLLLTYLYISVKRYYEQKWFIVALKCLVLFVLTFLNIVLYKFIIFGFTMVLI